MISDPTKPWIQFTYLFENIACITRSSSSMFKNNYDLAQKLKSFQNALININNAFTKTCYDIRGGKKAYIDLQKFTVPSISMNQPTNTNELHVLFQHVIEDTKPTFNYILNNIEALPNDNLNYLQTPIHDFITNIESVDDVLK